MVVRIVELILAAPNVEILFLSLVQKKILMRAEQ